MSGQVTVRDTSATDHVTFVDEANSLTESQYGIYETISQAFVKVVDNNWASNDNTSVPPAASTTFSLFQLPLEGVGTVNAFQTLGASISTSTGPLTDATGQITNPENLFSYFLETEYSSLSSTQKDTFSHLFTAYRDFVLDLVRTDLDGDDSVFIADFELYGQTISKYQPDDGDALTPRVLQSTPWSTQVKDAIKDIFDGGEGDLIDEMTAPFVVAYDDNWGPDGTSNFTAATGISGINLFRRASEHYLANGFAAATSQNSSTLVDGWLDFIAATATVMEEDNDSAPWDNLSENYAEEYASLIGVSEDNFDDLLRTFVNNGPFATDGYFIPGEHFAAWQTFLNDPDVQADPEGYTAGILDCPPPPVYRRLDMILIDIIDLITTVLKRLEETIVVQSNANLLNQDIQRKYTELISQVQLKDTSTIDTEDTQELEELKSDNEITQKRLEDLRNARTTVRDAGKELTDALSATNDQVEQQSQLGSSVISQLGELIRAIFR